MISQLSPPPWTNETTRRTFEVLCPDGVEYVKLKDCTEMKRGTSATKNTLDIGIYPVISGGKEPSFYCNTFNRDGETITVAGSGAGAGYVRYWNEPIFVNDAFSVKGTDKSYTKYIYYCLANLQKNIYATKKGGGVPHVHISSIENLIIPLPPLEIQKLIITILENLNIICNDFEIGLPAEIEKRQKQYEFYRDRLLDFRMKQ